MAQVWGLAQEGGAAQQSVVRPERATLPRERRRLSPEAAHSAHKGIFWLHLSAMLIWLLVASVFGLLIATGRDVPPVIVLASLAALFGHGVFLAAHLILASRARKRAAAASASASR